MLALKSVNLLMTKWKMGNFEKFHTFADITHTANKAVGKRLISAKSKIFF